MAEMLCPIQNKQIQSGPNKGNEILLEKTEGWYGEKLDKSKRLCPAKCESTGVNNSAAMIPKKYGTTYCNIPKKNFLLLPSSGLLDLW